MPVPTFEKEYVPSLGQNTAINPAEIPDGAQRRAFNAVMRSINTIGKRDGTIPLTTSALAAAICYMTVYRSTSTQEDILAASGATLYKFNGTNTLTPQTMTNALASSDMYGVAFTDSLSASILFITDGGAVKKYTAGSPGTVVNITPAPNDAAPAPPNGLVTINAALPKYCWVYKGQIFISTGNDTVYYSYPYVFDYFPTTQNVRFVRENDYINGCGLQFDDACFIPMRKGWGFLTGKNFNDIAGNQFLNTVNGVIAPRSIQIINYADGKQTIVYLSDDGVHEIYLDAILGANKQYATRSLMKDKIDFAALGLTDSEKASAVSFFDPVQSLYILAFAQATNYYALCYDTRNGEWYQWSNIKANAIVRKTDTLYYAGSEGHLRKFSSSLYSDWNESTKTTGTPVDCDIYSGLISFEFSGDSSYVHYYLVEAQQYRMKASIDVYLIYGYGIDTQLSALKNEIFIWGVSQWGEAQWTNTNYTDDLNNANRIVFHHKAKYFQRRWRNNRDEPMLILKEKFIGSTSGR